MAKQKTPNDEIGMGNVPTPEGNEKIGYIEKVKKTLVDALENGKSILYESRPPNKISYPQNWASMNVYRQINMVMLLQAMKNSGEKSPFFIGLGQLNNKNLSLLSDGKAKETGVIISFYNNAMKYKFDMYPAKKDKNGNDIIDENGKKVYYTPKEAKKAGIEPIFKKGETIMVPDPQYPNSPEMAKTVPGTDYIWIFPQSAIDFRENTFRKKTETITHDDGTVEIVPVLNAEGKQAHDLIKGKELDVFNFNQEQTNPFTARDKKGNLYYTAKQGMSYQAITDTQNPEFSSPVIEKITHALSQLINSHYTGSAYKAIPQLSQEEIAELKKEIKNENSVIITKINSAANLAVGHNALEQRIKEQRQENKQAKEEGRDPVNLREQNRKKDLVQETAMSR